MNQKVLSLVSVIIGFMFLCSSCCSIIQGRTQQVGIGSSPSGAEAKVDSLKVITPGTVGLDRNKSYNVTIEKAGYEPAGATITRHTSGWLWGNVLFGGLIGLAIDFATGAAYKLKPENLNIDLKKISTE